ncbi:amidase [Salipiger sp. IMCC34102]|uniref:amidase family protein n=1 Tax=Salipiger sp. IMCC34102 TaxID=2510647 RepID=UPI00101B796C|nr:amidase family protein [Salipiger sp. IMCC34102]RYH02649.1 amidase [Salipiger sp. IMCC34102]
MTQTPTGDVHSWTATQTLGALRARQIGAEELLDAHLARNAAAGGPVNAIVQLDEDGARKSARAADKGQVPGPLAGLPMTIKDCYDATGFATTAGIPDLEHNRPERDADAVARLKAAGAVIFGKTNVPLAASDHQSDNPIFGLTRNPWDTDRSAGGSSGGSAAALAAGLTSLEIGSDIGGSIRVPAHYCGVHGHKPSYGIVSSRGHVPPGPGALTPAPLSVCGPLARSAADLELALEVLAGAEGAQARGWRLDLPPARTARLDETRVALWLDGFPLDPDYRAALEDFADELERAGVPVDRLSGPPAPVDLDSDLYFRLLFAVIGSGMSDDDVAAFKEAIADLDDHPHAATIAEALRTDVPRMGQLQEQQAAQIQRWHRFFKDYDVLLAPVAMGQAFAHQTGDGYGVTPQMRRSLQIGGVAEPYIENLCWPGVATLSHLPSTVRPLPQTPNGLPAGVQIIGDLYADRTTLGFAAQCDRVWGTAPLAPDFRGGGTA